MALARSLNRTVVLPRLWCYCDKFWSRLADCAIPEAASSQPLPFVCPMDHVVELQYWHGEVASRSPNPNPNPELQRVESITFYSIFTSVQRYPPYPDSCE